MPEYLKWSLIENNTAFNFYIFINLQDSETIFTYRRPALNSHYADLPNENITSALVDLFLTDNSHVVSVQYHKPLGKRQWLDILQVDRLDRMSQFVANQHIILNMYSYHEACGNQIREYEKDVSTQFQYIICTREDIYFFKPIDLNYLIHKYMVKNHCGMLTKDCLNWGGVNMRFQLLNRDDGLKYLRRIEFYKSMYSTNEVVMMPEAMELLQTRRLYIKLCNLSIEEYPVVAARFSYINRTLCFTHPELKEYGVDSPPPCVPKDTMDFAIANICPREKTRYEFIPWQSFPFIPNSQFPKPDKYIGKNMRQQIP
jgi:hypothetical protein